MPDYDATPRRSGPSAWITVFSAIGSTTGLLAGTVGPMLVSASNLGPLLGVFVTGPAGLIVGALTGCVVWVARTHMSCWDRVPLMWISGIWLGALLYTLIMMLLGPMYALVGIILQCLTLGAVVSLSCRDGSSGAPRSSAARCRSTSIVISASVILMTLFPPVTAPRWGQQMPDPNAASSDPLPVVAFLFDPGLDARQHAPRLALSLPILASEWILAILIGAIGCRSSFVRRE